jgi:erythromycin esterase
MKKLLIIIAIFNLIQLNSQNLKAINWINENAIEIEDANPNTKLSNFHENLPKKISDSKIFGLGETTHHGKEFFDIKAKFFKYLVENHNVKNFIIEDSYSSEDGINEWISGGEGNIETIAENFSIAPWYCKEVVNLLEWMRNYNMSKPVELQIRYFGMDIQDVKNINKKIRNLVAKYNIQINEELLVVVDDCTEKKIEYNKKTDWAEIQIPKLNKIQNILVNFTTDNQNKNEFESTIRALNNLIKYTYFVQNNYPQDRDLKMFENVKWIVENKSKNGKTFIWAHNEHINYDGFGNHSNRKIYNLGKLLKEHYKSDYYSIGFDFGKGTLNGFAYDKTGKGKWNIYERNEPFPDTYAKTLIESKYDIYFIEMSKALCGTSADFFKKKNKQLLLGGPGYNPDKTILFTKKYSEMFDGLIFIKKITLPNYNLKIE